MSLSSPVHSPWILLITPIAGSHQFFSGDPALRDLENMTLVGNGRMLVDEETRVITVESRISKVVPATGYE